MPGLFCHVFSSLANGLAHESHPALLIGNARYDGYGLYVNEKSSREPAIFMPVLQAFY